MDGNPFIDYRIRLDVHGYALERGWSDLEYISLVREVDARLAEVAGTGFRKTPLIKLETPLRRPVWAKVETGNVGGSHKARHLFGLLLRLLINEPNVSSYRLAIASCGNAALGAANVAKAVGAELLVFVPEDADPVVLAELEMLGAKVDMCSRRPGVDGDPCITGLNAAVEAGAKAFTVQGTTCPNVIDGGRTLGLELAEQLRAADVSPTDIYIQIGGGALATATMDGLDRSGFDLPRLNPVQATNAHPYIAAWNHIQALNESDKIHAIANHPEAMKPWPTKPESLASGILDDITYDWKTVMAHQIKSGGTPVAVDEHYFAEAAALVATQTDPPADPTGAAGLAGLLAAGESDTLKSDTLKSETLEPAVVILSGRVRS